MCIWKDRLCSRKVAAICVAAVGEGEPADPSAFAALPGAAPLQRLCWSCGTDMLVTEYLSLYGIPLGSVLGIFS